MSHEVQKQTGEHQSVGDQDLHTTLPIEGEVFPQEGVIYDPVRLIPQDYTPTAEPSFTNLQAFVTEAARRGVHRIVYQPKNQSNKQWANQWNILGLYAFTDLTQRDIAQQYGPKGERIRQIVKRAAGKLYNAAPEDIKLKFERDKLSYRKPHSHSLAVRLRASNAHGGKLEEILALARAGNTPEEIYEATGLSGQQISSMRRRIQGYGVDFPFKYELINLKADLPKLSDPKTPVEERQSILDRLTDTFRTSNHEGVQKLSSIIREANLAVITPKSSLPFIVGVLKVSGIPATIIEKEVSGYMQRYAFIAQVDREKALEVLRTHPDLDKFRKKTPKLQDSVEN